MTALSRRRFIAISACAMAAGPAAASGGLTRWRGAAMGAEASIAIAGTDTAAANALIRAAAAEIARHDALFSLYRPDSALSRLNRDGALAAPPPDMLRLLSLCAAIHDATGGMFDPTVQPLMRLLLDADGAPDRAAEARARALIGWPGVRIDPARVAFARPGMALTLNGIAQGYATDRVADLLRAAGLRDVLVSVGEIAALGGPAPGAPWRIGLATRGDGPAEDIVALRDAAVATTAPLGTVFDAAGRVGHLADPHGGGAPIWRRISVIGPSAAVADGLSTALALMPRAGVLRALGRFPGYRAIGVDAQGARFEA